MRGEACPPALATALEVFDVSEAGDTVAATLALASGAAPVRWTPRAWPTWRPGWWWPSWAPDVVTADELAGLAYGEHADPVADKIADLDGALAIVAGWRARGLKVGFTNGCFDLLHPGHVLAAGPGQGGLRLRLDRRPQHRRPRSSA